MRMSRRLAVYPVGNSIFDETSFTYTGEYLFSGGDKWTLKFLTSGRLILLKDVNIDIFAVGGGGGGGNGNNGSYGGQGGGGGTYGASSSGPGGAGGAGGGGNGNKFRNDGLPGETNTGGGGGGGGGHNSGGAGGSGIVIIRAAQ